MKNVFFKTLIISITFFGIGFVFFYLAKARSGTTVTAGDKLTADKRNSLVTQVNSSSIPSGLIAPFNASNCPTGRSPANGTNGTVDLRGEFIRGVDNSRGVDSGRILGSWQDGTIFQYQDRTLPGTTSAYRALQVDQVVSYNSQTSTNYQALGIGSNPAQPGFKSRPRNVALLYCVKQ